MLRKSIYSLSVFTLLLCFYTAPKNHKKTVRILFVGNSLTYANGLPTLITELGGHDNLDIPNTSFSFPDYSLEDHLREGRVQQEIETGQYDFVVAQQGPSALPESQALLLASAIKLADICKKNKTKLALYMVWPAKARLFDLDNVISSYTNAATKTNSLLCPAGLGWKYAWQADSSLSLYSADNFHPDMSGSLLAALSIYQTLIKNKNFDFVQYETCSWKSQVSKDHFLTLSKAALKATGN